MDVRERHEVRSFMARNSTERLGGKHDLESIGSAFSCIPAGVNTTLTRISNMVLCWFYRGSVFAWSLELLYIT